MIFLFRSSSSAASGLWNRKCHPQICARRRPHDTHGVSSVSWFVFHQRTDHTWLQSCRAAAKLLGCNVDTELQSARACTSAWETLAAMVTVWMSRLLVVSSGLQEQQLLQKQSVWDPEDTLKSFKAFRGRRRKKSPVRKRRDAAVSRGPLLGVWGISQYNYTKFTIWCQKVGILWKFCRKSQKCLFFLTTIIMYFYKIKFKNFVHKFCEFHNKTWWDLM